MIWRKNFIVVERVTDPDRIDPAFVENTIAKNEGVVFQFSKGYPHRTLLDQIEAQAQKYPDRVTLRFYGFYKEAFDCEKIGTLKHITRLSVDCLSRAKNFEALRQYTLDYLSVGSHEGMPPNLVRLINGSQLKTFFICQGKTKIDLAPLAHMTNLKELSISAASKGIDAIAALQNLNWLQLLCIKKVNFSFVQKLPALQSLTLLLGGRTALDEIENPALRNLQIARIQGLNDLSVIQRMPSLEWLLVEDQPQLKELALPAKKSKLQTFVVINCKNLTRLANLKAAVELDHLRLIRTGLDFDSVRPQLPPALKNFAFYTGKKKVDDALEKRILEMGYQK